MNILFVAPMPIVPHLGGIQRVTDVLAKEMKNQGHNVYFLCRREKQLLDNYTFAAEQHFIPIDKSSETEAVASYINLLRTHEIDSVVFQWVDRELLLLLKATPHPLKVVSCFHSQPYAGVEYEKLISKYSHPDSTRGMINKFLGIFLPGFLREISILGETRHINQLSQFSDRVCFLSERFIPRVVMYSKNCNTKKYCGLNNPVPFKAIDAPLAKEKVVLFVGRIANQSKNVCTFIDVWDSFKKKNKDWRAIVVGDGPDLDYCVRYASKTSDIEFLGYSDDVSFYYKMAKFVCITSFGEGFPLALMEGMSFGCIPFVYDTFESLHDIIDDGTNGFISPPFNIEHMVNNMSLVAQDDELYRCIEKNAREKLKCFALDKIVNNWINLFSKIEK